MQASEFPSDCGNNRLFIFITMSILTLRITRPPIQLVRGALSLGAKGVQLATCFHEMSTSK